tara:strand:+ start:975 stop:1301 length:327 start_codon:yes stop_codon:yes gene_type:complete
MGFDDINDINKENKWIPYKDKVVCVGINGSHIYGVVKKIVPSQGYVYLQPCVVGNSISTELSIVDDLPATVPFNSTSILPVDQTLEECVNEFNEFKKAEQAKKSGQSK